MLLSCKSCHKEYVASNKTSGDPFICSKCSGRSQAHASTRLGLHPALERKFAAVKNNNNSNALKDMQLLPNIPGFDIAYQVGRGAMGSVYRARHKKSGRLVAIKVLSQELAKRTDLVARFEREAYALKSLNDKNVVAVLDAGNVDDIHYFAMEFIDGLTLRTRINRGAVSLEEAIFICSQILSGLRAAHKHGIIHRDLKPENVLLAYDGQDFSIMPDRVVLVDFGLVGIGGLAFDPHPNLTKSRVTMGTVNYMAPEQHTDAKRVDHRSDIYSAGVILFEMLTGDLPLGRYLLPGERGMNLPSGVDAILAKALARTLEDRYESSELFMADLAKLECHPEITTTERSEPVPRGDFKALAKHWLYTCRYGLLLLVAALFFGVGIKVSLASKPSVVSVEKKKT